MLVGSTQVNELGEIETPILLTCTLCVPRVGNAPPWPRELILQHRQCSTRSRYVSTMAAFIRVLQNSRRGKSTWLKATVRGEY
jgi:L-aminopeptidase/D-esterase-like protein